MLEKSLGHAYDKLILKNLYHNYSYDVQSEGDRAWYAHQLLQRAKHRKILIDEFARIFKAVDHTWYNGHIEHAFEVAYLLCQDGAMPQKTLLEVFTSLHATSDDEYTWGDTTLLKLGREGIKTVLRVYGQRLDEQPVRYHSGHEYTKQKVLKATEELTLPLTPEDYAGDEAIQRYKMLILDREYPEPERPPWYTDNYFEEIYQKLLTRTFAGRPISILKKLTQRECELIADLERQSSDPVQKAQCLKVFTVVDYPYDPLALIDRLELDDRRLTAQVSTLLSHVASEQIRELALSRIRAGVEVSAAIKLLGVNYRKSDNALLVATLSTARNQDDLHDMNYAVQSLAELNPEADLVEPVEVLIYSSRCGVCRNTLLGYLARTNALSNSLRQACSYDSYAETRQQYGML